MCLGPGQWGEKEESEWEARSSWQVATGAVGTARGKGWLRALGGRPCWGQCVQGLPPACYKQPASHFVLLPLLPLPSYSFPALSLQGEATSGCQLIRHYRGLWQSKGRTAGKYLQLSTTVCMASQLRCRNVCWCHRQGASVCLDGGRRNHVHVVTVLELTAPLSPWCPL